LKLKVITLRFLESAGGFDDGPLQAFTADKEVIDFSEHFFVHEKTPYLTLVLAYRLAVDDRSRRPLSRPDPRRELAEDEKQAYDALKAWRAARARAEGIPPYMIASNKQLAQMIKLKSASRTALMRIEGIGEAKAAKYADDILAILEKHLIASPAAAPEGDGEAES
jgi:superfamily II DNA helicase RecQ